ncbi:MAG: hypothetical protein LC749_10475, partial [Actinobacteria bacterium]|nr:hypothetical protein [Actinomycetota bacterium]
SRRRFMEVRDGAVMPGSAEQREMPRRRGFRPNSNLENRSVTGTGHRTVTSGERSERVHRRAS